MRRLSALAGLSALLAALPAAAQEPVRIDFDEYASPTTTEYQATIGAPVTAGGLDFYSASAFWPASRNSIGTWGTDPDDPGNVNRPVNVGSSTTLFATALSSAPPFGSGIDVFAAGYDPVFGEGLRPFRLYSIDVAHLFSSQTWTPGLSSFDLTFAAINVEDPGSDYFFQTFTIAAPPLLEGVQTPFLQTLVFDSRFHYVQHVYWQQSTGSGTAHQFTNVVAAVVPEPSTWLLMLTGLGGLGVVGLRRRQSPAAI